LPFYWSGALLQASQRSTEPQSKTLPVVVIPKRRQRIALHVDEVLGNQEVVVKNLGPQLSRLPGLAGMTVPGFRCRGADLQPGGPDLGLWRAGAPAQR
jgi:chemosensory pili system protein ChpA (sensor histidine kinase/response regulator)